MIARYLFMSISLIVCFAYLYMICKIPKQFPITYDQQSLIWITISLVFFNNPLFALNIYTPNLTFSVLS